MVPCKSISSLNMNGTSLKILLFNQSVIGLVLFSKASVYHQFFAQIIVRHLTV